MWKSPYRRAHSGTRERDEDAKLDMTYESSKRNSVWGWGNEAYKEGSRLIMRCDGRGKK